MSRIRIRKPVTSLSLSDLEKHPVWKYLDSEERQNTEDETWVGPLNEKSLPEDVYSRIVAAEFRTESGKVMQGFMFVSTANRKVEITPGAVINDGYFVLPTVTREVALKENYPWSIRDREKLTNRVKMSEKEMFPLAYRLKVLVGKETEYRRGSVE